MKPSVPMKCPKEIPASVRLAPLEKCFTSSYFPQKIGKSLKQINLSDRKLMISFLLFVLQLIKTEEKQTFVYFENRLAPVNTPAWRSGA